MAVGENPFPAMPVIDGCRLSAVSAGIRYEARTDLALIELCEGLRIAACFTQNLYQAAPVVVAKSHIEKSLTNKTDTRYLLINSGNANACTGDQGERDAQNSCAEVARLATVEPMQVLPFSTGVIGEPMNMDALKNALPESLAKLSPDHWESAARAIMTTDSFPKGVTRSIRLGEHQVTINGIAKGAGMIRPDMATMLAYVVTDAVVSQEVLDAVCKESADLSFNRITVDGDTSTNDACVLASTQKATNACIESLDADDTLIFAEAVADVFVELAKLLVRDGEGATKFVTLNVSGGQSGEDCLAVAYTVGQSPLVKTALFASDPNWGRIVAAIGRSGIAELNAKDVRVWLDDVLVVQNAGIAATYTESLGEAVLTKSEFELNIDLGMGNCRETIWTCDLSHEYVAINADYRS